MFDTLKSLINTESPTSSRRAILLFYAVAIGAFTYTATIGLAYVICIDKWIDKQSALQVLKWMVYLIAITILFILLLAGVITWQNVNDTINSVKGLPPAVNQIQQTIEKTQTTLTQSQPTQHDQ